MSEVTTKAERLTKEYDLDLKKIQEEKSSSRQKTPPREGSVLSYVPRLISELTLDNAKIDWIWEGFLAKGHITLFSALWKAGKSTLIAQLLKCIKEEKPLAGQPVRKTKVLIISEESEALWARRKEDLELGDIEAWVICNPLRRKMNYKEWVDFLEEQSRFCKEKGIGLLILDTLSGFWSVANENDAAMVGSALLPMNYLKEKNIAVMLVHHFRKSQGEYGVASRGSGALGSYVDILMEFMRLQGDSESTQRLIKSLSRFEETPTDIVIDLVDGAYRTIGNKFEVSKETKKKKLLLLMSQSEGALSATDIFDSWDKDLYGSRPVRRTIGRYVDELLAEGRLTEAAKRIVGKTPVQTYTLSSVNDGFEASNVRQDRPVIRDLKKKTPNPHQLTTETSEETDLELKEIEDILT